MSEIPGPGFGGFLIKAHIATHAPLALAALLFAAIGNVRYAIIALGAIVFMTWLNYMPSVVRYRAWVGRPQRAARRRARSSPSR